MKWSLLLTLTVLSQIPMPMGQSHKTCMVFSCAIRFPTVYEKPTKHKKALILSAPTFGLANLVQNWNLHSKQDAIWYRETLKFQHQTKHKHIQQLCVYLNKVPNKRLHLFVYWRSVKVSIKIIVSAGIVLN
jgi:hypothetical protein